MKNSRIEWIGEIPQSWETMRLQYCLQEINVSNNPVQTEQVLSLVKDVGVMLYEEKGNVGNKAKEDVSQYKLAYPNTLVLNSMNILIGSVGLSSYFGCVSPVYYVFKETDRTDLRFVNYLFGTRELQRELRKYANGILEIRLRVSTYDLFKRRIPFPIKHEQIRIADYLDERCAAIDEVRRTIEDEIEALRRLRKAAIHKAVTKGIDEGVPMRDSGVEWIGEIPEAWKVVQIKRIYDVRLGKMIEKNLSLDDDSYERYLCAANIGWGGIRVDTNRRMPFTPAEKSKYEVKVGDVLVMEGGATAGTTCLYRGEFGDTTYMQNSVLACRKRNGKFGDYLAYWMEIVYSSGYRDATCNAATFAHYTKDKVEATPILMIPEDEESCIVSYLDERCAAIDSVIDTRTQQLQRLDDYRKALIFAYVTGKKEVPTS